MTNQTTATELLILEKMRKDIEEKIEMTDFSINSIKTEYIKNVDILTKLGVFIIPYEKIPIQQSYKQDNNEIQQLILGIKVCLNRLLDNLELLNQDKKRLVDLQNCIL